MIMTRGRSKLGLTYHYNTMVKCTILVHEGKAQFSATCPGRHMGVPGGRVTLPNAQAHTGHGPGVARRRSGRDYSV